MENHPVPQNISSYEFHLVGDMTLKQFLQLAGGIGIGFIFIRLQIIAIIKWPLAILSAIIGVLMAFVPINGRPFSTWLSAFIKAIYSPTEYVWIPEELVSAQTPPPASPPPVQVVQIPVVSPSPPVSSPPPQTISPPVKPAVPETTSPPPQFSDFLSAKKSAVPPLNYNKETTISKAAVVPPVTPVNTPPPVVEPKPSPFTPITKTPSSVVSTPPPAQTPPVSLYAPASQLPASSPITPAPIATLTSQISAPSQPNILSGLIVDSANTPLSQTTVEVIDTATGIPARALRTNKLGQFQIAIPLPAGNYNIIAEKDGLKFTPVSIQVKGGIVSPVIIQGQPA
jgi:hypothetical protein